MIDLKTLRQLVKLMRENDLTEMDIEGEQDKVRLRRGAEPPQPAAPAPPQPTHAAPPQPAPQAEAPPQPAAQAETASPDNAQTINSPMVGTFYAAASPDADPFVKPGDNVSPDAVVCVIEAMKVFNEIKAEKSGVIQRVLVENGQPVEFDQPLFEITPA